MNTGAVRQVVERDEPAQFSARYTAAMAQCGGRCPIEAGVHGRLGRARVSPRTLLAFDRTPTFGCWPEEGAAVLALPRPAQEHRATRRAA